jgi:DNA-binding NarL/FixJ family response regulator
MTPSARAQRAVLLDEFPLWLDAVESAVTRLGIEVVGKTTSPDEALDLVERREAQVLVAEITTGGGPLQGLACVGRARSRLPDLKVVVLSRLDDERYMRAAFAVGADAYVLKTASPEDVALAVRPAFARAIFFPQPDQAEAQPAAPQQPRPAREIAPNLTRREVEILRLVAEGHSNGELGRMLWVTEQTVKFHLSNIYRKLSVANRTEASRWAHLHGLVASESGALSAA